MTKINNSEIIITSLDKKIAKRKKTIMLIGKNENLIESLTIKPHVNEVVRVKSVSTQV